MYQWRGPWCLHVIYEQDTVWKDLDIFCSSFICSYSRICKHVLIVPLAHSCNDCWIVKKKKILKKSSWLWLKRFARKRSSCTGIAFWLPWPWYLVDGAIKLPCKKWLKWSFYFLSLFLHIGFQREYFLSDKLWFVCLCIFCSHLCHLIKCSLCFAQGNWAEFSLDDLSWSPETKHKDPAHFPDLITLNKRL